MKRKPSRIIPFAQPSLGRLERVATQRVLRSGWLTSGIESEQLEREFAAACEVRYAVATSSATAALHIGLEVLGVNRKSVVLLSPYTYNASAAVAVALGARVVFVDITRESLNLDPKKLEQRLHTLPRNTTGAIMPIHIGGLVCQMEKILNLARHYSLAVIEDAAHAQPHYGEGGAIGARGDCTVFSFYATKPICSGEGGMIITESEALADRLRVLRNQGIDRSAWQRSHTPARSWYYDVIAKGYKYNLPDLLAATARVQLARATQLRNRRQRIAAIYYKILRESDWLELPPAAPHHAWHLFVVTLRPEMIRIDRDAFMERLAARSIQCSLHYVPLHITKYWRTRLRCRPEEFPCALQRYRNSFSVPIYASMRIREAIYVAETLRAIGARYRV